ncbi:PKD-like family lipoprotein [Pedobacter gandavensis]|uniref:PKD-like family lipoprotein n=1 Tax=Pedobacter gandavensis TaxID=2679963 RepID=UPI00292E0C4B|nr:PKD-like family lipoprotein [Pedobacter gandavensis]
MIFQHRIYLFLLLFFTVFTYSCKKDLGNYNYQEINEITFSAELNGKLTAYVAKDFKVNPVLSFSKDESGDTSRYRYEWVYIITSGNPNSGLKVLSTSKNLNVMMNLPVGTYDSFYRVTDKQTGVQFRKAFQLEVRNEFNEGWLFLTEVNGQAQLDMLSQQPNGEFLVVNDLLGKLNPGLKLDGKPKLIYSYNTGPLKGYGINLSYGVYVGTDKSTDRVHPDTFQWSTSYNVRKEILDLELPTDFHLDAIKMSTESAKAYVVSNAGNVLGYDRTINVKYASALNYDNVKKQTYKVAPFIGVSETISTMRAFFYDAENRRFMRHASQFDSRLSTILDRDGADFKFSYNHTGMDMLYMTWVPFSTGEIVSVLKDPASETRFLACFDPINYKQSYYGEVVSPEIEKAENYAISPDFGFLYYSVGSKLYQYNKSSVPAEAKLVLDVAPSKISLIKFQAYHNKTKYKNSDKLMVCSYDPGLPEGQNGKVEQYDVMLAAQGIQLEKTYTGFGKVMSMHYRER